MLCVSRDLFNEQAGAGGRLHERKLPMGDGEEAGREKNPNPHLGRGRGGSEEAQLSAQPSFALLPPICFKICQ